MNHVYKDNLNLMIPRKKSVNDRYGAKENNEPEFHNSSWMRESDQNTEQQVF